MEKTSNHYILILCGGSGPRLWPLSRASKPKQFLTLFNSKTLIENTYNRFLGLVPPQNIFFVSNQKYLSELKKTFGRKVSSSNFISEPSKKNTAMAILLGSAVIRRINPEAVISAVPSDHFIDKLSLFHKDLHQAFEIAKSSKLIVTVGIKPSFPNPAYGYILPETKTKQYFPISKFIEKPSAIDAALYIKRNAYWNSGIYTFSLNTLADQFSRLQPEYYALYQKIIKSIKSINSVYKISPTLAIDKAISEKSNDMAMIPARFTWSDIGQWQSIWQQLTKNKDGIALIDKQTQYVNQNSKNCVVTSTNKKLVGLVGLNNLAIIDTKDSLLVCNLNDSYSVRDLITQIVASPKLKKYFLDKNE